MNSDISCQNWGILTILKMTAEWGSVMCDVYFRTSKLYLTDFRFEIENHKIFYANASEI